MKVARIIVEIAADESDGNASAVQAEYDGETKRWTIKGPVYPRHLRALAEMSRAATEGEKA